MSFRLFIYYCALVGGWGAFLAWVLVWLTGVPAYTSPVLKATVIGGLLGMVVAAAVAGLDASLTSSGFGTLLRFLVAGMVGFLGGMMGGFLGGMLANAGLPVFIGWMLTGVAIGLSVGVYELVSVVMSQKSPRGAIRKLTNGLIGGLVGGLLGGLLFSLLMSMDTLVRFGLAFGLVLVGASVGLLIGLTQVAFSEAWLKVEAGFKPGRELVITKEETVIGRGEGCDIGLFGDSKVEKVHARIRQEGGDYLIRDENTEDGTYVNDARLGLEPVILKNGDEIQVGKNVLRFGTRQRQTAKAQTKRTRKEA